MRIGIVGGAGALGSLYARLFKEAGFQVCISDSDSAKCAKAARELGVECVSPESACADSDVVVVSVPISVTQKAIRSLMPLLRRDCLLMDFTSVKSSAVSEMKRAPCREVVGCHPMHGPRVSSLEGQVVVFTPVRKGERFEKIKSFFSDQKASVFETTPEEHDRMIAVVQALTHFSYLTTAATMRDLGVDVKESRRFASPVYNLTMDLVARIIGQDPGLYADIQMENKLSKRVRATFIKQAQSLRRIIDRKDRDGFVKFMKSAAEHYGSLEDGMAKSDKAIAALHSELKLIKEKVGSSVGLKNIYSGAVHFGKVEKVLPDSVELSDGKASKALKLSNVRVLSDAELLEWKKQKAVFRDYSFLFSSCDPAQVRAAGQGIDENVLSAEVMGTYPLPNGTSVTLRFGIFSDADVRKIDEKIRARYIGLGARQR